MEHVYYATEHPGSYGGVERLRREVVKPRRQIANWLSGELAYSINKPYRKRFPTRKYKTSGINDLWQMDLMEMIPYASINKGYRYILTCIDIFSRFARVQPLKSKSGIDVMNAITTMFESSVPTHLQTDLGKEFYNSNVKQLLKKHGVNHYSVHSQFKAAIVERFNRTLRDRMKRYFTHKGHKIWFDVLQDFVTSYNNSKHRGIYNQRPVDINTENESALWQTQQKDVVSKSVKYPYSLHAYVRISRISQTPFVKNFDQNWSEEIFRIVGVDTTSKPIMYIIEDIQHNVIEGKFYQQELQVVPGLPDTYRIEKIIKTRGNGKHKQYLVKWYGYNTEHNSWISASQIDG